MPIVGVMGSGSEAHVVKSVKLGCWLASLNVHLLTGSGMGVMQQVSEAFAGVSGRKGLVIGIVPGEYDRASNRYAPIQHYPNPWVEVPIYTHLPDRGESGIGQTSRNHINILTCDVIVFLSGGAGTVAEAQLSIRYAKPAVAWLEGSAERGKFPKTMRFVDKFSQVQEFVVEHIETNADVVRKPHT